MTDGYLRRQEEEEINDAAKARIEPAAGSAGDEKLPAKSSTADAKQNAKVVKKEGKKPASSRLPILLRWPCRLLSIPVW
ncbi:hypothetical protein N7475_009147 [Penicillium sp. IBT 31633x]|nr:hypothetical protein N7475_009147 [Penicillium sp. IBT 31633x]